MPLNQSIGVFLCGPGAISQQLVQMCHRMNPPKALSKKAKGPPRFYFHKENF